MKTIQITSGPILLCPKARRGMIIHHAHCLHEGITNRRADESEATLFEFLTHDDADGRRPCLFVANERLSIHKLP